MNICPNPALPANEMPAAKCCRDCGIHKPLTEFPKRSKPRTGHGSYCHPCMRVRWRRWAYGEGA